MDWVTNRTMVLASLAGGALCILAAWQLSNPSLSLLAALFFFLSLLLWKAGYFLLPLLSGTLGTSLRGDDYELVPSQDVLLKRTPGGYVAVSYLGVQLRESASAKDVSGKALLMDLFERAISSMRYSVKLSVMVCPLDLSDYADKLQERRSLAEHKKAQLSSRKKSDEAARLEREIESYSQQLRRLTGGERPMQVIAFASTCAEGLTREEALSRVRAQASETAAVLSNSLSCHVWPLAGEELLRASEWERAGAPDKNALNEATF